MSRKEENRIVFYSKNDGASGHSLKMTEALLQNLSSLDSFEINDLLELYHIKMYFDNGIFLARWEESTISKFKEIINQAFTVIKSFWLSISNENILAYASTLEFSYRESFWKLINDLNIYKKIDKEKISAIIEKEPFQIYNILTFKNIVTYFDKEIKAFLLAYPKAAELLLTRFEQDRSTDSPIYFFPNCLSLSEKEDIINKYIEYEDANLNFIRLIEHSKDSNDLKFSPKTRLKAQKRSEQLNNEILEKGHSLPVGIQIALDNHQTEPVKFSNEGHIFQASYSKTFLDKQKSDTALFYLFKNLFEFIDSHGLITLVSKESELDVLEKTIMKSKNEYANGYAFQRKGILSDLQILSFELYLNQRNSSIEKTISSFIKDVLNSYFDVSIRLKFPTHNLSYLEKIRVLTPEFEYLLKQYLVYVDEGQIDFELLEIDSNPLRFGDLKSLMEGKYVYINNEKIYNIKYYFFSDQSTLYYVEPYGDKYSNLFELLTNEDIKLSDFKDYQKPLILHLISENYLLIDLNSRIKFKDEIFTSIIKDFQSNDVLCYWHYPDLVRKKLDEMIQSDLLKCESTLFSRYELNYLNYYLNKKEFTNGLDLRNKYLHGSNKSSEKQHEHEYRILLKLIILTILKITDDLMTKKGTKF
jgi:hypothetical protein